MLLVSSFPNGIFICYFLVLKKPPSLGIMNPTRNPQLQSEIIPGRVFKWHFATSVWASCSRQALFCFTLTFVSNLFVNVKICLACPDASLKFIFQITVDSFGGAVWCLSANYEKTHLAVSNSFHLWWKFASKEFCSQTVSLLRSQQFLESLAQGKLWALKSRQCSRTNNQADFTIRWRLSCLLSFEYFLQHSQFENWGI